MSMLADQSAGTMPALDDTAYAFFQRRILKLTGIDLTSYKSQQMRRRLGTMMARNRVNSLYDYAKLLDSPDRLREFLDFFTINVSEFLRIPDKFEFLATKLLPPMLARGGELKIWSAGCSNGAEPYSMAMLLDELAPYGRWSVLATDVDRTILARAERADKYTPADLRNVSPKRLAHYFEQDGATYRVKDQIRRKVKFQAHDLLKDAYPSGFSVVACRHVVIYFTEEAKDVMYRKFVGSMVDGGVLFVGGTEIIPKAKELGLDSVAVSFYRKAGRAAGL